MDLVSVIIPVYNAGKYIERCIQSIQKQKYENIEIILINDGSIDDSQFICQKLKEKDNRIRLINKKNEGVSVARNTGLKYVTGKYITFIDSDDWIEENYIHKLVNGFQYENVDIVCCNYFEDSLNKCVRKMSFESKIIDKEEALNCFSPYYFTSVWGKLFKREIVENLEFESNIYYSEDTLFYTEAVLKADKVYWIQDALYHYYINTNGALKNKDINKFYTDFIARKQIVFLCKYNNELYNRAKYMALLSAISIKMEMAKQNNDFVFNKTILDDWIIDNYKLGLRYAQNTKDKIKIFLCRHNFTYKIMSMLIKLKLFNN